jgi:hypothetical protein
MQDKQRFLTAVRMLSNGKQPGPDEIPNELFKRLPDDWHTLIHNVRESLLHVHRVHPHVDPG